MLFFTCEKTHMSNQLISLGLKDYFYLDAFWRVNLGMCIIEQMYSPCLAFVVHLACFIVCFIDL